jgi:acetyltransferase-like isoleucine patch superfamily enzyme
VRLFERQAIGDRPLLLLGMMLLFIGVQLMTFGLLAELLARTYYESQNKPTYVIREIRQTPAAARAGGALMAGILARRARSRSAHHRHPAGAVRREASKADKYRDLVIGRPGWGRCRLRAGDAAEPRGCPGALGLFLRSKLYPLILGRVGRNVVFGVNVTMRHPHKIQIGDNVVIDDGCCLDAKGTDNRASSSASGVFIGRNTILSCKNGDIVIEDNANIGFNCEIFSASRVRVGKSILMAAYTYLVGGDHLYDRVDIPVLDQGRTARGIDVDDTSGSARTWWSPTARRLAATPSSAPARWWWARSRSSPSPPAFRRR